MQQVTAVAILPLSTSIVPKTIHKSLQFLNQKGGIPTASEGQQYLEHATFCADFPVFNNNCR